MEEFTPCIQAFFDGLLQSPRLLLDKFILPSDGGEVIAQAIASGTAAAVSDGSFDDKRQAGSSAFIIAPSKDKGVELLEGANFVTGARVEQSAYRSELAGVLGVLTCVEALVKFYNLADGSVAI